MPCLAGIHENDGEEFRVVVLHLGSLAPLGLGDDHLVDRAGIEAEDIAAFPVLEENLRQEVAPLLIQLAADAVLHQLVRVRIGGVEMDRVPTHLILKLVNMAERLPLIL